MTITPMIARNADGGGGGAPAPAAATPPAAGTAAGGSPPVPGEGTPPAPGAPVSSASPAASYWPDGLDQALRGADDKATLDNIAKVVKGYRDRDALKGVPETPEGYYDLARLGDTLKLDEGHKPYFDMLKDDPAFSAMAKTLHRHGVGQLAALEAYRDGLAAMGEAGLLEPLLDPKAEMAALVPEALRGRPEAEQQQAAQRRMQENFDFLALAKANMGLDGKAADYAEMMLGDSAKGHAFLEWLRGRVQGGGAGPTAAPGAGGAQGVTAESLRAEQAALKPSDPDYKAKQAALDEKYRKFYGG